MNSHRPIQPPRRQPSSGSYSGSGSGSGSSSGQYFNNPIPRPEPPRSYSTSSSEKRLPPVPVHQKEQDPFAHDDDDYAHAPTNSFLQPKPTRTRTMEEGWNTFQEPDINDRNRGVGSGKESWKGKDVRGGVESPTSSRGTRDSAQTSLEENPFR